MFLNNKSEFIIPQKLNKEEQARLAKQRACQHEFWWTRCSHCGKILGSDRQKNIDTEEDFKNNNPGNKHTTKCLHKINYALDSIYLEKEQETAQEVAGYTFEEILILKGQAKVIFGDPFEEDMSKQVNLTAGERLRLKKSQPYVIKTIRHGVALTITKINL